jgi:predicted nucleic acid-binding protein
MYLIDTSILIHLMGGHPKARSRLDSLTQLTPAYTSVIAEGELLAGIYRLPADARERELQMARVVLGRLKILPVNSSLADRYGRVRAYLKPRSRNDAWIAATALEHGLILVTDDADFGRVPDLIVENWVR